MNSGNQESWLRELKNRYSDKSWFTALLLSLFFGWCGLDRLYLGYAGLGIFKMLTLGGSGIWWVIDFFWILFGSVRDADGDQLKKPF